jgi:predicted  nucleic acid-binding Zn-ribbon protein
MPHQCTNCNRTFADGSKEMLSGCPDCGGNKFQFRPSGESDGAGSGSGSDASVSDSARPETSGDASGDGRSGVTGAAADVGSTVRDWVGTSSKSSSPSSASSTASSGAASSRAPSDPDPDDEVPPARAKSEDSAQASARSDVVSPEELSAASTDPDPDPDDETPPATEETGPDLSELREELNDQFESIKIVNPGQYELNLMELYDRDEYIISLREDGRYVIEVPDRWNDADAD